MGLTIHYELKMATGRDVSGAKAALGKLRARALQLPFKEVGELIDMEGAACEFKRDPGVPEDPLDWLKIQASQGVTCPWNERVSRRVSPSRILAFTTWPGEGCEEANFGLCRYPSKVEWEYRPQDDERFQSLPEGGVMHQFDWSKWEAHKRVNPSAACYMSDHYKKRQVATKLGAGWYWRSFCKTQYANDPECGGMKNFLQCHLCVIGLLDFARTLGLSVHVDDEGKYGPATYSDDWKEAYAAGRKPTYTRHEGRYSVEALAEEVGEWDEMLAAWAGEFKDMLAGTALTLASPIAERQDFEHLEARGVARCETLFPDMETKR